MFHQMDACDLAVLQGVVCGLDKGDGIIREDAVCDQVVGGVGEVQPEGGVVDECAVGNCVVVVFCLDRVDACMGVF